MEETVTKTVYLSQKAHKFAFQAAVVQPGALHRAHARHPLKAGMAGDDVHGAAGMALHERLKGAVKPLALLAVAQSFAVRRVAKEAPLQ